MHQQTPCMLCSPSCMEEQEEDLGAWLGLGIGGGGAPKRGHGERRSGTSRSRDMDEFETIISHKQAAAKNTAEEGAGKKRLKKAVDDDDPSPSGDADGDGADDGGGTRKKLRLSKEQSTLLEDTFRCRNILSHAQKHELARRVNLTPRQVEVWFQNRRVRTKLKQTEVDRDLLKRCCESLADENRRLKLELMELQQRSAAASSRLHVVQLPRAATADTMTTICPPTRAREGRHRDEQELDDQLFLP